MNLTAVDFVQLGCNDDRIKAVMTHPLIHLLIVCRRVVPDIDQQKDRLELLGGMQIALDHLAPLRLDFLIGFCVAIARQIYQIKHFIYIIKVDGLGFAGLGRSSRQAFPVHDPVDEGGFANVTLSGKCNFRQYIIRKLTRNAADRFQLNGFDYHISCFLSRPQKRAQSHRPSFLQKEFPTHF